MALETKTTLDGLLKDLYTDVVREQISTYSPIHEKFEKVKDYEFDGRQAIEVAIMSLNEGVGAAGEDANVPTAGNFDPQQFKIPMKYVYGSFKMTKQMMESAKNTKGAFKNATRYSMQSLIRNLKRERARMIWGAGNGILARVNGATATTTVNVDNPMDITSTVGGARFLRKGMIVSFWDSAGTTHQATRTISAVAANGQSITIDSAFTTIPDNAVIRRMNTATGTGLTESGNEEPMGLLGLVDDGTFVTTLHGLSRTTFPQLKSRVQASVGALSLDAIQLNFDIADQQGDANIECLACHHAVRRAYATLLEADRRYSGDSLMSPDGGTKVTDRKKYISFGGVNVIEDKYAPYDTLFGLDTSSFTKYEQIDGEWADDDGAILNRVSGKDTWEAMYRLWENYQCCRPNANFRMEGITTTKVYVASF